MILRKLVPETYDYIYTCFTDDEIMAFLGLQSPEELYKDRDKYQKGMTGFNRSFLNFLMIDRESGKVAGCCGYHTWYTEHQRAEIGYAMYGDEFRKQGLMSEALREIIAYGFDKMQLNRIEAFVGPYNVPSLKLMEKMNFVREGQLRQHYCKKGVIEDSIVFSLLKEEYQEARRARKHETNLF